MYEQILDPVGDSLARSAMFAVLPLLTLFILLGALKIKAWIAALASLGVALAVAIVAYSMPLGQALLSATEGATFGFFPIMCSASARCSRRWPVSGLRSPSRSSC